MTSVGRMISLALLLPAMSGIATAAGLLSIEEAKQLSQATGRPILAMAGSKT